MHEQATLVAFYGEKRDPLASLIDELHQALGEFLGPGFTRYVPEQVHATILGLEASEGDARINLQLAKSVESPPPMDLAGYLRELRDGGELPFTLRIAGFRDRPYSFTSRSQRPFLRSFSIQDRFAVLVGWPQADSSHPPTLDRIRRAAGAFHIRHRYHRRPGDFDNDLYIRLGNVDRDRIGDSRVRDVERSIREWLAALPPLTVAIGPGDLSVICYTDETLPWGSCRQLLLPEIHLDSDLFAQLHPEVSDAHEDPAV